MQRRKWRWSVAAGVLCAGLGAGEAARAQSPAPGVVVGALVNMLRLSESSDLNLGIGGRVGVDVAPWLSLEGEYQFVPDDELEMTTVGADGSRAGVRYQRRRSTALLGVKAGYRGDRVGVFAKVRPGLTRLSHRGVECRGEVCALMLLAIPDYRREFALDLGGVVELYPSSRWLARVDVGGLVIKHRSTAPPCAAGDCTTTNLSSSVGVGLRF